jgi:cobalt-zinc-cadmium efflux system outer membrane protein
LTEPSAANGPQPAEPGRLSERLKIPPELPGAEAPPLKLPPATAPRAEKEAAINRLFPTQPPLGPDPQPVPGPDGRPLTLADLQQLALNNSPVIRQAAADVEAARGALRQAGLYPNPNIGYEGDTAGTGGTAGYQGGYVEQQIKTAGKLRLAQAVAAMDLRNAEVALRRARADLMTQVRAGYFAVLVARENVRVTRALAGFTDEVYRIQVEQVRGDQAAAYEPLQLRVLAGQARAALVQARNRFTTAWKQLAATLGLPNMPLTELAGRVDMPLPRFDYDQALAQVVNQHTDVLSARNTQERARYSLRLAQVTPIPDVDVRVMVQKDFTTPPFLVAHSVQVGIPVPVWNRNQGNILQAEGVLLRALEETERVHNDLTARLAEAFERYQNSQQLLEFYRTQILPDQVRAYRGVYDRHQQEPEVVRFGDVVVAQQTLANTVTTYIAALGAAWTAVVDVANLLQTTDLFQAGAEHPVAPVPDLPTFGGQPPACPASKLACDGRAPE